MVNSNNKGNEKNLVSILMAVYNPNYEWFKEQLISLNNQTYENIELIIYDDCPDNPVDEEFIKRYIDKLSYYLIRGKNNRGSNKAFEELTKVGKGDYFAYCDQDDIWETDKIEKLLELFEDNNVTLVCCDLSIINEYGEKTNNSIREIRKRLEYKSGYNLAQYLLMTNFITGCAMMVRKNIALKAVPFVNELIHDQWIGIIAAIEGKIEFLDEPLVRYRQHNSNQTGILKGVNNKETYYFKRIDEFIKRYNYLKIRLHDYENLESIIDNTLVWLQARKSYSIQPSIKDLRIMIKYRNFHKISILIELLLPIIPNFIFKKIIEMTKKGLL